MCHRRTVWMLLLVGLPGPAWAQPEGAEGSDEVGAQHEVLAPARPSIFVSVDGHAEWGFGADLSDASGDMSVSRVGASVSVTRPLNDEHTLVFSVAEEVSIYDISSPDLIGGADPIDSGFETSIALSLVSRLDERWTLRTSGEVHLSMEGGADVGDSITYGGVVAASYRMSDTLTLGAGAAIRTQLEDSVLIVPALIVNWQIMDRLRLSTGGSTGGVRLTLAYDIDDEWTATLDGGYDRREFRLDDEGPVPGGVFTDQRVPVALGVVYSPGGGFTARVRGGMNTFQSIQIDDAGGGDVTDTDVEGAFFVEFGVGLSL